MGPFNGNFDAVWELFNRFWRLGAIIVAVSMFVFKTNQDHVNQGKMEIMLVDVAVEQKRAFNYMRDSLATNDNIDALVGQSQGVHDDLYRRVLKLEGKGEEYRLGRGVYRKSYGPMPSKRFEHWFWQE